jgi:hypothetical protein
MSEAEWLAATDPLTLLKFLRPKNPRKCRLFACATCRRIQHLATELGVAVLDIAERFADGQATFSEIDGAQAKAPGWSMAFGINIDAGSAIAFTTNLLEEMYDDPDKKEDCLVGCLFAYRWAAVSTCDAPLEWRIQCCLVRDIFGNPFRPVALDPSWRTEAVVALAEGIYQDRAFDRMPVLADALEDAGCSHPDIMSHCRGDGPHVKGCWVVDLLTGRK